MKHLHKIHAWILSVVPSRDNFWKSRKREDVVLRNCIMFILRKHTDLTTTQIGKLLNKRHSTIVVALKMHLHRIDSRHPQDYDYKYTYNILLNKFPTGLKNDNVLHVENGEWKLRINVNNLLQINT